MDYNYKLFWTEEALRNLDQILEYLQQEWTPKEVDNFMSRLSNQLNIILRFPTIFPKSDKQIRLRKSVLSKHTTIYYEIKGSIIYVVYLFDNRQNPNNLK